MAIKIRDLAKELEVSSEDILDQLRRLYVEAEGEESEIDEKIAGLIRIKLGKPSKVKKKPEKKKKTKVISKKIKVSEDKETDKAESPEKTKKKETEAKESEKTENEPEKEKVVEEEKIKSEKTDKEEKEKPDIMGFKTQDKTIIKPAVFKKIKKTKKKPVIEIIEKGMDSKTKKSVVRPWKMGRMAKSKFGDEDKTATVRKTPQKVQLELPLNIRTLAPNINAKPNLIIQYLMGKGVVANINQDLEEDVARDIMEHFGYELEIPATIQSMEKELVAEHRETKKASVEPRAPVVTFMGHVDHGKTSLLDYIRKTMVTKGEKGGITQHIGAYKVKTHDGSVTFLDTPGHAAFTAMRARGANATDVVVLVVAADDGVMPQTKEAIDHARAAGVSIVVAINKCDLASANPDKVKMDLQKEDLVAEEWGGKTIMVEVSAQTGEGIDRLIEMLMLESEMLELKSNPKLRARGVVIESKKTQDQGVVATLLVQNGTLYPGDIVLCGAYYGKVKAMIDDKGERLKRALPSTPVEVLGLQGVPFAGEEFFVVKDEKKAKTLAQLKQGESRRNNMAGSQRVTLEDLHSRILAGKIKELKIIIKGDVQGSVEALAGSLKELDAKEVKVNMIHSVTGNINESDVMLALVSNAVIIGFNVKIDPKAENLSKSENIDVRIYDVIYEAIADVKAALEGLLEPEEKEVFQGSAQIKEVFPMKGGKAAGCAVIKGILHRKDQVRVKRGSEVVFEGYMDSLKRFKDDVREVKEGFECGISLKGFKNINKNDIIEAFIIEKIARRLEK
ncbi:MAG: translation initiation factor IF-2 [Candidatus Omnitrophota bacterium]